MPLKPSFGDRVVGPVVSLYNNTERSVLKWLARILMPFPGGQWVARMLARLLKLRRGVKRITKDLDQESARRVGDAIGASWEHGAAAAFDDLNMDRPTIGRGQADTLTREVFARIAATHPRIAAWAEQVFHQAVDAGGDPTLSETERAAAVQQILNQAAEPGVTGYTDPHGRRHNVVSYVETTVRAASTFAEVEAYIATLASQGHDLVVVSDVPQACALCRPFEGRVLSIAGASGAQTVSDSFGRPVTVTVYASIAEARARGLWHPGCRHVISVWTADSPTPPTDSAPDEAGYRQQQRLRGRERLVRSRSRVVEVAQSRAAAREAKRKLAAAESDLQRERLAMASSGGGSGSVGPGPKPPHIPPSPFDAATTNLEVAQILQLRHGIPVVGFDHPGVPLEVVQEYARAVDDVLGRYPSLQLGEIKIETEPFLKPELETAYAITLGLLESDEWRAESISLNGIFASHLELMKSHIAHDVAVGFHIPETADRPVYTAIVHEFGHVIDHNFNNRPRHGVVAALTAHRDMAFPLTSYADAAARDAAFSAWLGQLTGYCFTEDDRFDPIEAIGEAFCAVEIQGDSACEPAKVIHRMLMDMIEGHS